MTDILPKEFRDKQRPIKVLVTESERDKLEQKAAETRLPISTYLRNAGLSVRLKSTFDNQAILALSKVNADQGRLGGLLKLWLSTRPGTGMSVHEVRKLLHEIETAQIKIRQLIDRL